MSCAKWRGTLPSSLSMIRFLDYETTPGGDGVEGHDQACHGGALPRPDSLRLWTSHEQCGEEVGPRLQELEGAEQEERDKKGAIEKDMKEFMEKRFQIESRDQPINILDILDMMIAPDVDASISANGVRENEITCKRSTSDANDTKFCLDSRFSLNMGSNCLYLSTDIATYADAVTACQSMGAELATLLTADEYGIV